MPLEGHTGGTSGIAELPDGRLVSIGMDQSLRVWDVRTGAEMVRIEGVDGESHPGRLGWNAALALADGRVAVPGFDGSIAVWNLDPGDALRLPGHMPASFWNRVTALAAAIENRLVSGGSDGTVRLWDLGTGVELARITAESAITHLCVLNGGRTVAATDTAGCLHWLEITR